MIDGTPSQPSKLIRSRFYGAYQCPWDRGLQSFKYTARFSFLRSYPAEYAVRAGKRGLATFRATSAPATGKPAGFSKPICTSTLA